MKELLTAWLIGLPFVAAFMFGFTYFLYRLGFFERHAQRMRERAERERIERERENDA